MSNKAVEFITPAGTRFSVTPERGGLREGGFQEHFYGFWENLPNFCWERWEFLSYPDTGSRWYFQGGWFSRQGENILFQPYQGPEETFLAEPFLEWLLEVARMDPRGIVPEGSPKMWAPRLRVDPHPNNVGVEFVTPGGTKLTVTPEWGGLREGGPSQHFFDFHENLPAIYREATEILSEDSDSWLVLQGGDFRREGENILFQPPEGPEETFPAEGFIDWLTAVSFMNSQGIVPERCPWVWGPTVQLGGGFKYPQVTLWNQGECKGGPKDLCEVFGPPLHSRVNFTLMDEGIAVFWRAPRPRFAWEYGDTYPTTGRGFIPADQVGEFLETGTLHLKDKSQNSELKISACEKGTYKSEFIEKTTVQEIALEFKQGFEFNHIEFKLCLGAALDAAQAVETEAA